MPYLHITKKNAQGPRCHNSMGHNEMGHNFAGHNERDVLQRVGGLEADLLERDDELVRLAEQLGQVSHDMP